MDTNRIKRQIIEVVTEFFETHFTTESKELADRFVEQYEGLLSEDFNSLSESERLLLLIRQFKPAISNILEPGATLDNLMHLMSPTLNEALAQSEQQRIQASFQHDEQSRLKSQPTIQYIPKHEQAENLELMSVGIDIGSSTSHLVFSKLLLHRERSFTNPSNRFVLKDREILYESDIIFTPLIDKSIIDVEEIVKFCKREYEKAGYTPDIIDTGAVIVTGETAKKQNAEEIAKRLSSESGKFVSAVAGPNYESVLAAMGSGIVHLSSEMNTTIMNVDIGGGTSNIAIASRGVVHSTSCINVGGRLLGIDGDFRIWRIDEPTKFVMKELELNYSSDDIITEDDVRRIARAYAEALIEVMRGPAKSPIAKELMMTDDLDFSIPVTKYAFSGGIAEIFYGSEESFDDIGVYLAQELRLLADEHGMEFVEPLTKIRATVIGAGAYTLSVSGSSCYVDKTLEFPIVNIPVLPINVTTENYRLGVVESEINRAFSKYDIEEGTSPVGLYFRDPLFRSYSWLQDFVRAIENALPNTVAQKIPVILLFRTDIGKMVGLMIKRETAIQDNLISLDELYLEEGDWIDIGAPMANNQLFPVTVKSLVFNQHKEY